MELIDLLIKIANGEKPKRFKLFLGNNVFEYELSDNGNYYNTNTEEEFTESINLTFCLNHKVEIIKDEEEKKIPEQIEYYHQYDECAVKDKFYQDQKGSLVDEIIIDKVNEIIDYLKSKGDV